MIGERVVFIEDFEFRGKLYKKGHKFTVIGCDSIRGFDLEDDYGNRIYETRFIRHMYKFISKFRDGRLKELGI